ncbi:MAG: hypothetical protein RLY93_10120 [Sumerlaeia bacterium]
MAQTFGVGPYRVLLDARGIRLWREGASPEGINGLLIFTVAFENGETVDCSVTDLRPRDEGLLEFSGHYLDRIAIEGKLFYDPELQAFDIEFTGRPTARRTRIRLGLHMELMGEAEPRWLIPGLFYNDNRLRDCQRMYPGFSEIHRDAKRFLSNHWCFRSDRAALPAVICSTYGTCGFLATEGVLPAPKASLPPGSWVSEAMTGLGIDSEGGAPKLSAFFPYLEEPVKYSYCRDDKTEPDHQFLAADPDMRITLKAKAGFMPYKDDAWIGVYRRLYRASIRKHGLMPHVSPEVAEAVSMEGLMRYHVDTESGMIFETTCLDKHYGRRGTFVERDQMHCGWLGGAFPAYTLLWKGRESMEPSWVRAAHRVIDRICMEMAPCGTLWPLHDLEDGGLPGVGPDAGLAHARTIAEAILFIVRSIRLDISVSTVHSRWTDAISNTLDFAVSKQREDGAFPAYWNVESGEPFTYDGAAGMAWIPALIASSNLLFRPDFRQAAIMAGEYYSSFIEDDFICGCQEDLPLVPSAEDGHMAVIAYMLLYEMDRDERWLQLARKAADWALTFRMAYNVQFSPWSMLAQGNFQTRGGDISSVATPVLGASGLLSYPEMLKLSALTRDTYYQERAHEARLFAAQLVACADGHYNARQGQTLGQIFHTDWWQPKGKALSLAYAWSSCLLLYAGLVDRNLEIPAAALEGDVDSILAASSTAAVAIMGEEEMPVSAEELLRRRSMSQVGVQKLNAPRSRTNVQRLGTNTPFPSSIAEATPPPTPMAPLPSMHDLTPEDFGTATPMPFERSSSPRNKKPLSDRHTPLERSDTEDIEIRWNDAFDDEAIAREQEDKAPAAKPRISPELQQEFSGGNLLSGLLDELKSAKKHTTLSELGDEPTGHIDRSKFIE